MKLTKKSEDAISPVVGVMLMIVVTVILVAVVSAFGTGLVGDDTTKTPIVRIQFDGVVVGASTGYSDGKGTLKSVDFTHKGGDALSLDNIEFSMKGESQSITNYFPGDWGTVEVSGGSSVAEAGDIISIKIKENVWNGGSAWNGRYKSGEIVEWVLYDTRTDGIIAQGDFVVPDYEA